MTLCIEHPVSVRYFELYGTLPAQSLMHTIECFTASYGVVKLLLLFKKKSFRCSFVELVHFFCLNDSWEYEVVLQTIRFIVVDLNIILPVSTILQYLKKYIWKVQHA